MIPTISKIRNDFYNSQGYNWFIKSKHGTDAVETFITAVRYWLWHCGIPAKYCFKKSIFKNIKNMKLNFVKLAKRWYAQLPEYPDGVDDLEVISGTDELCDHFDKEGTGLVTVIVRDIPFKKKKGTYTLTYLNPTEDFGADYKCEELDKHLWLCNVTKHVFGDFPKTIYIKVL